MNNKETKISRCYTTKSGEFIVSFKFQFGELSMIEKEDLQTLWRDDVSLQLMISRFQDEEFPADVHPDQTAL